MKPSTGDREDNLAAEVDPSAEVEKLNDPDVKVAREELPTAKDTPRNSQAQEQSLAGKTSPADAVAATASAAKPRAQAGATRRRKKQSTQRQVNRPVSVWY